MNRQETLKYLYGLERFGMVFGLDNISRLLQALGNPHNDLKVIHVGGTNGKGSVSVMMAAVLQEEGYRVGLYTSPHLVSFTERIQINGDEISWEEVVRLTDILYGKVVDQNIPQRFTFFDFTTALAMYYFFLQGVDVAILEVGLGGRLDSTNVVHPLMSVITNVDRDHYQILGESIKDITREKAGIIKQKIPLISGATKGEVIEILEETCRAKESPMRMIGRDFCGQRIAPRTFDFQGCTWSLDDIRLGVAGSYQIVNATVALAALELLEQEGYRLRKKSMYHGLATVRWPGRLEFIQQVPQILLDGAHNAAAAKALRACLQEEFDYRHIYMVMGVMIDKEVSAILAELASLAEVLIATRPQNSRAMPPQKVAAIAESYCKDVRVIDDIGKGVDCARALAQEDDLIVVTGSLFTVGEARAHLSNEKQI